MNEMFNFDSYVQPEGIDPGDYVVATYLLRSYSRDILNKVASMAVE